MRNTLLLFLIILNLPVTGQTRNTNKWVDFGSGHVNQWIQVAPGKMGPNALPVPEMDYAIVGDSPEIETGVHSHFMEGDQAINSYFSFKWTVVPDKVAIKFWSIPTETFRMSNEVRDERQIYYDDTGWITNSGDLWISTHIQLLKDKRHFPDVVLNYSLKTTLGTMQHARFSDASVNYYYLSLGKSFFPGSQIIDEIRIAGLGGFYVWQTNKVEMAQDEGPLFEAGIDIKHKNFSIVNEIGGYFGYDAYDFIYDFGFNDPILYRAKLLKYGKILNWKFEYQTGFQDYGYNTFKLSVIYRFSPRKSEKSS